ncbi:MAG: MBL fold metallo-hydrolase [Clostridia bacterium]
MITFCSLFSGSSGNAIYIANENTKILIDCGVSGKRIAASLATMDIQASEIDAILVTHEHKDHTHAVGIMSRRYNIPIYANENTWEGMQNDIGTIKPEHRRYFNTHADLCIKDICIHPFSIPHDAAEPVGYNFYIDNKKITLATDIGHIDESLIAQLEGSEMILIESNHDVEMLKSGSYPYFLKRRILGEHGHLSNEAAGELVAHLALKGTTRFLLGHLSKENNFPQLAYQTTYNELESRKIKVGKDVLLEVADREKRSKIYNL